MTGSGRRAIGSALMALTLLSGCGDSEAADEPVAEAADAAAEQEPEPEAGDEAAAGGDSIDCDAIAEVADTFGLGVQTLAQLRSQAQYDLVNDGVLGYDPAAFDEALAALAPLEAIETPLGSVAEGLDVYAEANALAAENLTVADPFTEAKGDELATLTEDTPAFLGHQAPINYAIDEAGC